jgi:hypothetical protein
LVLNVREGRSCLVGRAPNREEEGPARIDTVLNVRVTEEEALRRGAV